MRQVKVFNNEDELSESEDEHKVQTQHEKEDKEESEESEQFLGQNPSSRQNSLSFYNLNFWLI